jgi:hypothetical protein
MMSSSDEPVLLCGEANGVATLTDAPEAYAVFAEKRDPSFTGRWAVPRLERQDARNSNR